MNASVISRHLNGGLHLRGPTSATVPTTTPPFIGGWWWGGGCSPLPHLSPPHLFKRGAHWDRPLHQRPEMVSLDLSRRPFGARPETGLPSSMPRSEANTSELQPLLRISSAVFGV